MAAAPFLWRWRAMAVASVIVSAVLVMWTIARPRDTILWAVESVLDFTLTDADLGPEETGGEITILVAPLLLNVAQTPPSALVQLITAQLTLRGMTGRVILQQQQQWDGHDVEHIVVHGVVALLPDVAWRTDDGGPIHRCTTDFVACMRTTDNAAVALTQLLEDIKQYQQRAPWVVVVTSDYKNASVPAHARHRLNPRNHLVWTEPLGHHELVKRWTTVLLGPTYGDVATTLPAAVAGSLPWLIQQIVAHLPIPVDLERQPPPLQEYLDLLWIDDAAAAITEIAARVHQDTHYSTPETSVHTPQAVDYHDIVAFLLNITQSKSPLQNLPGSKPRIIGVDTMINVPDGDTSAIGRVTPWRQGVFEMVKRFREHSIRYLQEQHVRLCEPLSSEQTTRWYDALDGCAGAFLHEHHKGIFNVATYGDRLSVRNTANSWDFLINGRRDLSRFFGTFRFKRVDAQKQHFHIIAVGNHTQEKPLLCMNQNNGDVAFLSMAATANPSEHCLFRPIMGKQTRRIAIVSATYIGQSGRPMAIYHAGGHVGEWDNKTFDTWVNAPAFGAMGPSTCADAYSPDMFTNIFRVTLKDKFGAYPPTNEASSDVACKRLNTAVLKLHADESKMMWSNDMLTALFDLPNHSAISQLPPPDSDAKNLTTTAFPWQPFGHASLWVQGHLPVCENDCAYPLVCIDTGSCRCVHPTCSQAPHLSRDLASGHPDSTLSLPENVLKWTEQDLTMAVKQTPLTSLMLPVARLLWPLRWQYWPNIVSPYVPDDVLRLKDVCRFITDPSQMTMTADHLLFTSVEIAFNAGGPLASTTGSTVSERSQSQRGGDPLVMVPYHMGCDDDHNHEGIKHARKVFEYMWHTNNSALARTPADRVVWVLTHDWGACLNFEWTTKMWEEKQRRPSFLKQAIAVQPCGDWDSVCFEPHKDVVIPPRLSSSLLVKTNLTSVPPINQRRYFAMTTGNIHGDGAIARMRLQFAALFPRMEAQLYRPKGDPNYPVSLRDVQFCFVPAGVLSWSFRFVEAVYAGCIPVISSVHALFPFFDLLDYKQLVVVVPETDFAQVESILLAISPEQKQRLQTNLLRVRSLLLYGYPGGAEEAARLSQPDVGDDTDIGPLEMVLTNLALRLCTFFPTS